MFSPVGHGYRVVLFVICPNYISTILVFFVMFKAWRHVDVTLTVNILSKFGTTSGELTKAAKS